MACAVADALAAIDRLTKGPILLVGSWRLIFTEEMKERLYAGDGQHHGDTKVSLRPSLLAIPQVPRHISCLSSPGSL